MSWFKFNGVSSDELGIIITRTPFRPTWGEEYDYETIPEKSKKHKYKNGVYGNMDFAIECVIGDMSRYAEICGILSGEGILEVSTFPGKYIKCEAYPIEPTSVAMTMAEAKIAFDCEPFAYAIEKNTVDFTKGFTEIINSGTMYSEPTITFDVIPAEAPMLMGDVNFDGVVDASDASLVSAEYNRILKGEELTFTPEQNAAADMNGNGKIDLEDVAEILNTYAQNQTDHSYSAVAEKYVNINVNGEELIVGLPSAAVRSGYPVTIDCSVPLIYYTTSDGKKVNIMQYSKGDFPLLKAGTNYVKYSGDITNAKITVNERWK